MFKKLLIAGFLGLSLGQGAVAGILPRDSADQYELTFWNSVKDSSHPEDYELYLKTYPRGRFAPLAEGRMKRLRQAAAPRVEAPPKAEAPAAEALPPAPAPVAKAPRKKIRPAPARLPPVPLPAPAPEVPPLASLPSADLAAATREIKESQDCPRCPVMVEMAKGLFTMGSEKGDAVASPAHSVAFGGVFAIGKSEVSVEEWEACTDAGICAPLTEDADASDTDPVRGVNWNDAQRYVEWLSRRTGKPYRLPTEAEWEYAARGGPVGIASFAVNPFGLQGLDDGVWEWVSDCWHDSYRGAPPDGSAWDEPSCQMRVIRGGAWHQGVTRLDPATRWRDFSTVRAPENGLRVARDAQ